MSRNREPPPDIVEYIKKLERRISNLETNNRLGFSSVDKGKLIINATSTSAFEIFVDGNEMFEVGADAEVGFVPGMRLWRTDGSIALILDVSGTSGNQYVAIRDREGHTVVSDDTDSGYGLGRPWLPVPFYPSPNFAITTTTTSSTFVDLQYAKYVVQHPYLKIEADTRASDGSTSGEIVTRINGINYAPTLTVIGLGVTGNFTMTVPVASLGTITFGTEIDVTVAARRTAGAGNIGVRVREAYGRQSL